MIAFDDLWQIHQTWAKGSLYDNLISTDDADIFISNIPGAYNNYACPKIANPNEFNIENIEKEFEKQKIKPSLYLDELRQDHGFVEFFVRRGYKFYGGDTWMVLDQNQYKDKNVPAETKEVTPEKFNDYRSILSKTFKDFEGNEKYLDMCLDSISRKIDNVYKDFESRLYLIYENDESAAGAGLFLSKEGDFAYLHDAGTLEKYRGKGYQTSLIRHRINQALDLGINNIYNTVEMGSQSWSNNIKNGFNKIQTAYILTKPW